MKAELQSHTQTEMKMCTTVTEHLLNVTPEYRKLVPKYTGPNLLHDMYFIHLRFL